VPTSPAQTPVGPIDTAAQWAVIVDFTTGATLLDKDADVPMPPSSMTKLMTEYLVEKNLASGKLKLDQMLPVSERAWKTGGSRMFVQVGTTVSVEDLLRGLIVDSGNDACIVLAEGIAGSEEQFVVLMNAEAKRMGLTQTNFQNCNGLPDPDHHMSVRDIATLARQLIIDFPQYYHYDAERTFRYNNIEQLNRNELVQRGTADGLKTGHTDAGGYGLCASALRGEQRVILVINGVPTSRLRAEEGERLMDWAFRSFENVTLFAAGDVVDQAPVYMGVSRTVPLVGGRDLVATMPRDWRSKTRVTVSYESPLRAPVRRGAAVGTLSITGSGMGDVDLPLLAGVDVPRLGLPGRALEVLTHMVTGA
jgi:D-alanyl-D-alanine carboxypeptidase (penicillin-binding protein 5/6)